MFFFGGEGLGEHREDYRLAYRLCTRLMSNDNRILIEMTIKNRQGLLRADYIRHCVDIQESSRRLVRATNLVIK